MSCKVLYPLENFASTREKVQLSEKLAIRRATREEVGLVQATFRSRHRWKKTVLEIRFSQRENPVALDRIEGLAFDVVTCIRLFKRGKTGLLEPIALSPCSPRMKDEIIESFYTSDLIEILKTRGYQEPRSNPFHTDPFCSSFYEGYELLGSEMADLRNLFWRFQGRPMDGHMTTSIVRMNRAQSYNDFVYGAVDNIIALESLLKKRSDRSQDVIRRVRILSGSETQVKHLEECYKIRNDLVHGDGRRKVKDRLESIRVLDEMVACMIRSMIPLYREFRKKDAVLKEIDRCVIVRNRRILDIVEEYWNRSLE